MASLTNKYKDVQSIIEQRRQERLEKAKQREKKILEMKMKKIQSREPARPVHCIKRGTPCPVVRQTKTSQKRIDIVNLKTPEYEELRKIIAERKASESMMEINITKTENQSSAKERKPNESRMEVNVMKTENKSIKEGKPNESRMQVNVMKTENKPSTKERKASVIVNKELKVEVNEIKPSTSNLPINSSRKQWRSPKPLPVSLIKNSTAMFQNHMIDEKSLPNQVSTNQEALHTLGTKMKQKSKDEQRIFIQNSGINKAQKNFNIKLPNGLRKSISASHLDKMHDMQKSIQKSKSSSRLCDKSIGNVNVTVQEFKTPKPCDLQRRLIKWLKLHGKEISAYKNLHLFGTRKSIIPKTTKSLSDDKENKLKPDVNLNNTMDDQVFKNSELNKTFEKDDPVIETQTPESILNDLYALIVDGYPKDQCNQWLLTIKKRYESVKELSIFWECKALLETDQEDFQAAIDSYKKAVITGAEKMDVEKKLCSLFDKMCSLNIDPKSVQEQATNKENDINTDKCDRMEFASSIVKFAVCQSRKPKSDSSDDSYFVTPVRRSSRLWSKTPTSTTPFANIQYVSSLNTLDENVRRRMTFTPNKALDI